MSHLPDTNGGEFLIWMRRAEDTLDTAVYVAGKQNWHMACHLLVVAAETALQAAHIVADTPVPRKHDIRSLLSTCPVTAIRESVYEIYDRAALNHFSRFYYARYPDGEDADQGNYLWCSQVAEKIVRCVREALP